MSGTSAIEWTDATWNPTTGCTKVSPGCAHCYAETLTQRYAGRPGWPAEFKPWTPANAAENVVLHPDRLEAPFSWRTPRRVFVNSMSDLFHEEIPDGFIARVWLTMARTPQHTYQILTKRPERMREWVKRWSDLTGESREPQMVRGPQATREAHPSGRGQLFAAYLDAIAVDTGGEPPPGAAWPTFDWMEGPRWWGTLPLPNVWLGVTVENQRWANHRIPILLDTPAAVRFLSCEPMLGPIDLAGDFAQYSEEGLYQREMTGYFEPHVWALGKDAISWVIVGGESGRRHRPFDPDWARSIVAQCKDAGVAAFVKQLGGARPGNRLEDLPEDLRVREFPC